MAPRNTSSTSSRDLRLALAAHRPPVRRRGALGGTSRAPVGAARNSSTVVALAGEGNDAGGNRPLDGQCPENGTGSFECKRPVHFSAQTRSLLALEMNFQDGLPVGGQLDQDDAGITGHVLVLTGTTVQLDFGVVVDRELLFLLGAARFLVEFGEQ